MEPTDSSKFQNIILKSEPFYNENKTNQTERINHPNAGPSLLLTFGGYIIPFMSSSSAASIIGIILLLFGFIMGLNVLNDARKNPGAFGGKGFAIIAIILGLIAILILGAFLLANYIVL